MHHSSELSVVDVSWQFQLDLKFPEQAKHPNIPETRQDTWMSGRENSAEILCAKILWYLGGSPFSNGKPDDHPSEATDSP